MELAHKGEAIAASPFALLAGRTDARLGRMVGVPVALRTALEVLILLAGVISLYVFRNPFVWSDELASILFLWLAMLGAGGVMIRVAWPPMSTLVGGPSPRLS